MAKKKLTKQDEQLESVNEALSRSERWIEENQKMLTIVVTAIVVVVFAVIAVNQWVLKPNKVAASNDNAQAEVYFEQAEQAVLQGDTAKAAENFRKALEGDDADCVGFLEVADNYSNQEAELAALYAGLCYAELGQNEEAAEYLSRFSAKDITVAPAAAMRLGDVYVELGQLEDAAKAFEKAAENENEMIAPVALSKAARVYLKLEDKASARRVLETIKTQYPGTQEANEADKYLPMCAE